MAAPIRFAAPVINAVLLLIFDLQVYKTRMVLSAESTGNVDLPGPESFALEHSRRLCHRIAAAIAENEGAISFVRYMQMALYEPGLGYYSSGSRKFGPVGDFVTAPEISPVFALCLARQCVPVLESLNRPVILEPGPGTGAMAATLLQALEYMDCLPEKYFMLELSADLRQRQQDQLSRRVPHLLHRIVWLDQLPGEPFEGIIIGNEVVDAIPVHRLVVEHGRLCELCVGWKDDQFIWKVKPTETAIQARIDQHLAGMNLPEGYQTEINLQVEAWLCSVTVQLQRGLVLLVDYGYPRSEYYHPQRRQGTLLCHYRHHVHADPFLYPGLQDITASVDFTLLAEAATAAGLQVSGYTTQAHFLINTGLDKVLHENRLMAAIDPAEAGRQIRILTLPGEMGERFKVMALTKNLDSPLAAFQVFDQRGRL